MRTSANPRAATELTYVERVNRAIDHIHAGLHAPLRLDELARVACLSPFHFHRVFQAMVGETPADFVRRLRLEKALRLMAHGARPTMGQIAAACGFASATDFSRAFRKRYGVAPRFFDLDAWCATHAAALQGSVPAARIADSAADARADEFPVRIRALPPRTVAYIRVARPYHGDAVPRAAARLLAWAERHGVADRPWLGYQWEHPEVTALGDCSYYIAVEADAFPARGEVGRYEFPAMTVAEVEVRGGVDLELRVLQWLYGHWLPRSRYVPDDLPGFEAFIGRPFAHGMEYFELAAQIPVRRA